MPLTYLAGITHAVFTALTHECRKKAQPYLDFQHLVAMNSGLGSLLTIALPTEERCVQSGSAPL